MKRLLEKQIRNWFKERPNAVSGRWNFWLKSDRTLHVEYQCGNGADVIATLENGKINIEHRTKGGFYV